VSRRCHRIALALAACTLPVTFGAALAQPAYPSRLIRLVVPYAAGGNNSTLARLLGQKLTESWGQSVLVDNRPGGNTTIGTDFVAKAPADGYTLLLITAAHTMITPTPYDPLNDFAAVATLTSSEKVLVVHPALPVRTLHDLIVLARAKPGQMNFSSPGMGGLQHLAGELFNILAGVKIQHIPYKGGGQAVSELMGGQVQLSFQNALAVVAHVKSGRLRGLAVSGERRLASLPQIPTFAESGLKGFEVNTWFGLLARTGAPADIIGKLNAEVARILDLPDVRDKLVTQEMYPFVSTPEQFTALMRADAARYARVIKTANIKLDTY